MLPLRDNVPTRTRAIVTPVLIIANVAVFIWELGGRGLEEHIVKYAYYPCAVVSSCIPPATLRRVSWPEGAFTSMFMHAGWAHLLGNMLFLWIFGNNVEDAMGKVRFTLFYLFGGLAATAVQTVATVATAGSSGESVPNLGASGAIAAVLGAYIVLLPRASVLTFVGFFLIPVPAFLFLGFWFVFQIWLGGLALSHPETGGGVAFFAHVGGFAFGLLLVRAFQIRQPLEPRW